MKILQVSKAEVLGGAERIAQQLFAGCRERGEESWLAVADKRSADPGVLEIPERGWSRAMRSLVGSHEPAGAMARRFKGYAVNPGALRRAVLGQDSFAYSGTRRLLELPPARPDVVHAHNLHGSYFDLRVLPLLAKRVPVVLTMHDAWMFTGGCTHPLDCTRYLSGCGGCPYRHVHFRAAVVDSTAFNHRRKKRILSEARVHLLTPCRWLMDKVEGTMLEPAVQTRRVIPNGVDVRIFRPGDRAKARAELALPQEARVILHASATPTRNASKDYPTMRGVALRVASALASRGERVVFLVVGEEHVSERIAGNAEVRFLPFTADAAVMARCYAAADVYLQASIADTFPNTVLEAMACAVPAVATAVGGIPEQVSDGESGILVHPGTSQDLSDALAAAIVGLLTDQERHQMMGAQALSRVQSHFTLDRQIDAHLGLYRELLQAVAR